MLNKALWLVAALVTAALGFSGCGSGGGGGDDGGGDTGPPSVTGYRYVLTFVNETVEEIEITRGTTSMDWIAVQRQSGESVWGTYTVLGSGVVKMVRTGYSSPGFVSPPVLYAVELPQGYLFLLNPEEGTGSGGYLEMDVAFNQEATCAAITTQGAYNLVKTGQEEWDQTQDAGFGTATFSLDETGVDLGASLWNLGANLGQEYAYGVNVGAMGCAAGMGGAQDDQFAFTATGVGVYTHSDGTKDHDFVALPEPADPVDETALMAVGKRYAGIWQGWETVNDVPAVVTYLVEANGEGNDILADTLVNPDTGALSEQPATFILARAGTPSDRHGLFDDTRMTLPNEDTFIAISAAYAVGGKHVIVMVGQFDPDGTIEDPEDWFFMVLIEQ
jgi:hypothetical protein